MDFPFFAAGIGAAVAVGGAGFGISRLSSSALEGMARQPEASADLRGTMIIAAALIEGIAFFALIICLLLVLLK